MCLCIRKSKTRSEPIISQSRHGRGAVLLPFVSVEAIFYIGSGEMKKPKKLVDQSQAQQEAYVHLHAQDTRNIIFTNHALKRMKERKITACCVLDVLRHGRMRRPAEPNIRTGSLECRLDRYVAGRDMGVVVAIDDDDPALIVVTAMD